jgi:hypothetical protein
MKMGRIGIAELHDVEQGLLFPGCGDGVVVGDAVLDDVLGPRCLQPRSKARPAQSQTWQIIGPIRRQCEGLSLDFWRIGR